MRTQLLTGAAVALAAAHAACGQLITNGGFETGSFGPWAVTPTAAGTSLATAVSVFDIDGPGPILPSHAARFMVGRTGPSVTGWEGIELTQNVQLQGGQAYRFWLRWAVHPLVNVYSQSGGRFELIVNGQVIQSATAPSTAGLTPSYGFLHSSFTPALSGSHAVGVRIARTVLAGEEVFQYVDLAGAVRAACICDCNLDGNLNVQDFGCFQSRFIMGDPYADLNLDGLLTVQDFGAWRTFFITYGGPCP